MQERLDQLPAVIARRLSERDIQDNSWTRSSASSSQPVEHDDRRRAWKPGRKHRTSPGAAVHGPNMTDVRRCGT